MFGRKFKLFRLFGFEVGIDLSWILIAVLVAWSLSRGYFPVQYENLSPGAYWAMGIAGAAGLFASIVAHEFSHSLVARRLGIRMKGITLFLFGGVAEMPDEPPTPGSEFWMAVAGPLASIAVGALFYGADALMTAAGGPGPVGGVFRYLGFLNLALAVFNLVPAFPLDGGRILRSILWRVKGSLAGATRIASRIGSGFGTALVILGFLRVVYGSFVGGMWLVLIGMFLQGAARSGYRQLITRRALEGESLDRFMTTEPETVDPSITIRQLVEDHIYRFHFKMFPVVDPGSGRLAGCVTSREAKSVPQEDWDRVRVRDAMDSCSEDNTVSPDADVLSALARMRRTGTSRLMVVRNGRLAGVIALKDLLEFISLKVELEEE